MDFIGWDWVHGFIVFQEKTEDDAQHKCDLENVTLLGTMEMVKENILHLMKEQKMKLAVLVELYGGCFQDVQIFSDPEKASNEQEKIAKESGFKSAKELLDAVNDGCWDKAEPHFCPEIEIE